MDLFFSRERASGGWPMVDAPRPPAGGAVGGAAALAAAGPAPKRPPGAVMISKLGTTLDAPEAGAVFAGADLVVD